MRGLLPVETVLLDRIQVPEGPCGVIGGVADVGGRGGLMNLVRKQAGPGLATELSQALSLQDSGQTGGGYDGQNSAGLLTSLTHQGQELRAAFMLQADCASSTCSFGSRRRCPGARWMALALGVIVRNVFDRQTYGPWSDPRYLPLEPGRSVGLTAVCKSE